MARKLFFFLVAALFVSTIFANGSTHAYVSKAHIKKVAGIKKPIKKTATKKYSNAPSNYKAISLANFDSIQANGNFNITVEYGRPSVAIDGDTATYVSADVVNGTLLLSNVELVDKDNKPIECPTANIRVSLPALNDIYLLGNSTLVANNVRAYGTTIAVNDNSSVRLSGDVHVKKISAYGNGNISIRWIDSDDLLVLASDNAEISVAGVARILEARLSGAAYLNAKYLRPDVAFVNTTDIATADVLATHSMYAFATDSSNIYYYKTPVKYIDESEYSANVLQMGYWR